MRAAALLAASSVSAQQGVFPSPPSAASPYPPYISGRTYLPLYAQPITGGTSAPGRINFSLVTFRSAFSLNQLGTRVNTAVAASNAQFALYTVQTSGANAGKPGTLICSTISLPTVTNNTQAEGACGTGANPLAAGTYYVAWNEDTAGVAIETSQVNVWQFGMIGAATPSSIFFSSTAAYASYYIASAFGTWTNYDATTSFTLETDNGGVRQGPLLFWSVN